jgi:hypothetical protein
MPSLIEIRKSKLEKEGKKSLKKIQTTKLQTLPTKG